MFTGIVEEIGRVVLNQPGKLVISGSPEIFQGMRLGDSMAVNGVCLTVTAFDNKSFSIDVMQETLKRTNLGMLKSGDKVNLERPLALGGRMGGHLVQGHIDDTGRVVSISREGEAILMRFEAASEITRYVVEKGFIAVDGASLTVVKRDDTSFTVSLVEYTQKNTTLGSRRTGDTVNLEVDIIAKYVENLTRGQSNITMEFLGKHGFVS